jgi:hypothetical protein
MRDYQNKVSPTDVTFFIGNNEDNSITKGFNTLFIIGVPDIEEIARVLTQYNGEEEVTHIYFGAEQSFKVSTYEDMSEWIPVIQHFLTLDYWCTLDLDLSLLNFIHETELSSWNQFVPVISVKIPYISDLGYNAIVKIDDSDFNHSNVGVWCHRTHDLMSYDKYTPWGKYADDVVVRDDKDTNDIDK